MFSFQVLLLLDHPSRSECHDPDSFPGLLKRGSRGAKLVFSRRAKQCAGRVVLRRLSERASLVRDFQRGLWASHVSAGLAKVGQPVVALIAGCRIQLRSYLIASCWDHIGLQGITSLRKDETFFPEIQVHSGLVYHCPRPSSEIFPGNVCCILNDCLTEV